MSIDRAVFIDTWALLALANRSDGHHGIAVDTFEDIKVQKDLMVTSDFILDETITALFNKMNFEAAQGFIEALFADIKSGQIHLERIDEDRFNYAWLLRLVYRDKQDISFTDLTSFVLMKDLDISRVFTGDRHFKAANLGFDIFPEL